MSSEAFRDCCLAFNDASEVVAFSNKTLVCTVKGDFFCTADTKNFQLIHMKCNLEEVAVQHCKFGEPGPCIYVNRKHLNSSNTNRKIRYGPMQERIRQS